jgi:hypothetical protein
MLRVVVQCPVACVAILTQLKLPEHSFCAVAHKQVSAYCPACGVPHTQKLRSCKVYRVKSADEAGRLSGLEAG